MSSNPPFPTVNRNRRRFALQIYAIININEILCKFFAKKNAGRRDEVSARFDALSSDVIRGQRLRPELSLRSWSAYAADIDAKNVITTDENVKNRPVG